MPQIIKTISLSPAQAQFLEENKEMSLSKIAQREINNIMEHELHASGELRKAQNQIIFLNNEIQKLNLELDKK